MATSAKTILIVEDERDIAEIMAMLLEKAGYRVRMAGDGKEALELALAHQPDLIVTDILMPVMDGYTLVKQLKQHDLTRDIPIIVLTARGQMEDALAAAGVDEFLEKPSDKDLLFAKIEKLLDRSRFIRQTARKVIVACGYDEVTGEIGRLLTAEGCRVETVRTGPEVISTGVVFLPHFFILDIQLAAMPTPTVVQVLRLLPECKNCPILVYSYFRVAELGSEDFRQRARDIDRSQARCLEAGASAYLGRYNRHTFLAQIGTYFK